MYGCFSAYKVEIDHHSEGVFLIVNLEYIGTSLNDCCLGLILDKFYSSLELEYRHTGGGLTISSAIVGREKYCHL